MRTEDFLHKLLCYLMFFPLPSPIFRYIRNQILAFVLLLGCVQLLDFLAFHHTFGPWTITLRAIAADFGR